MKLVVVVLFSTIALLAGCATAPVPAAQAHTVPTDRLLAGYASLSSPSAGLIKVTIVRDSGMLGAASPALLSIDGTAIAKLRSSERIEVYLTPDTHIFGVEPSPRLMGALVENSFNIRAGKSYFFRISIPSGGSFVIQPSTQLN